MAGAVKDVFTPKPGRNVSGTSPLSCCEGGFQLPPVAHAPASHKANSPADRFIRGRLYRSRG